MIKVDPNRTSAFTNVQNSPSPVNLPYPGLPAVFEDGKDDWNKIYYIGDIRRSIQMHSTTEDSLIRYFILYGYWDDTISISINYKSGQSFDEYLLKHGITSDMDGYHHARTLEGARILFKSISQNNELPKKRLDEMNHILEHASPIIKRTGWTCSELF